MSNNELSRYPSASLREVFFLAVPLFFSLVSANLMGFCDRLFLSYHSLKAFEAVGVAAYLSSLFQSFCIIVTYATQGLVSRSLGGKNEGLIGPYTWQMVWFSLFSIVLVIPIGFFVGEYFFNDLEIAGLGWKYFKWMLFGNFLFPMGAAFASFHTGIGKTKVIAWATLITSALNIALDGALIFGIRGFFPPLGVEGAAIATLFAQGNYVLILWYLFRREGRKKDYQTGQWSFRWALFWDSMKVGLPKGVGRFVTLSCWLLAVHFVTLKGEDYIIALSFGSTLWLAILPLSTAIAQSTLSVCGYVLGKNQKLLIFKSIRSSFAVLGLTFLGLLIPFSLGSHWIVKWILPDVSSPERIALIEKMCLWVLVYYFLEGGTHILACAIIALKETLYNLYFTLGFSWLILFIPYFLGFYVFSLEADKVWMCNWFCCMVAIVTHTLKVRRTIFKETLEENHPIRIS